MMLELIVIASVVSFQAINSVTSNHSIMAGQTEYIITDVIIKYQESQLKSLHGIS